MNWKETIIFWLLLIIIILLPVGVFVYQKQKLIQTEAVNIIKTISNFDMSISENFEESTSVKILFVGDMMFDRGVAGYAEKNGVDSIFSKINDLFMESDAVIGNLEGTVTNNKSIARQNNEILRFTFDPDYFDFLKRYNFSAVSLANNHALDFGADGYNQTLNNLDKAGISYFGSPSNDINISTQLLVQGKIICLIGYHDLFTFDEAPVITEIEQISSSCDYTILFAHWGEEYQRLPTDRQILLAHSFIDAGADLVIGAHPHVVQPVEVYKNRAIFYSLGNFVFDQYFSFETEHGLAVRVDLDEERTTFSFIPTTVQGGMVEISNIEDSKKTISSLVSGKFMASDTVLDILETNQLILLNAK